MTIVVAYKWAADPQNAVVAPDGSVDWSRAAPALSGDDPVAIEVGRLLADAAGADLVGITVGTAAAGTSAARKAALGRGLDRCLLVADDDAAALNLTQVGAALAGLVRRAGDVRLVLTGDASVDENAHLVPALIAGFLGWPCFEGVRAVAAASGGWTLTQDTAGGTRVVEVTGPVVVAVTPDAATPRVPGLRDLLAAGKKTVDEVSLAELAVPDVPLAVIRREKPPARARKGVLVATADELVAALRGDGVLPERNPS